MSDKNTVVPLYFNSRDRINIDDPTTDYTIKLRKDLRNISSIEVSNVGIPRAYTNINKNNNTLIITFSTGGDSLDMVIEIDNRNYTESELRAELQNKFDLNQNSILIGLIWVIDYDADLQVFNMSVQYLTPSIEWNISFTYTALVDVIGIGGGGTTNNVYSAANSLLVIPINRRPTLYNNIHFNITSNALTNDINTSYVVSLAKSFTVNSDNNKIMLDTKQTLTKHISQLELGSSSIGDVSYGFGLDISGNGGTIISGAPNDDGLTGSVYTNIIQNGSIIHSPPKTQTDQFLSANGQEGFSVAVSSDGLTMITGSPGDNWVLSIGKMQGAANIYTWTGSQWEQVFKIIPGNELPQDQQLGTSVAISGDGLTVAVSSYVETLVYKNIDNVWTLNGKFAFATNPCINYDGTIISLYNAGDIEIWTFGTSWGLTQSITHSDPVVGMSDSGDVLVTSGSGSVNVYINSGTYVIDGAPLTQASSVFGISAAISGDGTKIAVGDLLNNPGVIWVYTKTGSWGLEQQLTHTTTDSNPNIGANVKLSTDGNILVSSGHTAFSNTGGIWVWEYNTVDNIWEEFSSNPIKPVGSSSDTDQGYSSSIAHGGHVFVTGGPLDDSKQGAVWVYRRDGFSWNQDGEKIVASDLSENSSSRFGHSVSISKLGKTIAVGAIRDFGGGTSTADDTGAVWIYRYDNGWTQQGSKLFGSPYITDQFQGTSVSLSYDGNILAIGAPRSILPTGGDGTVFIFIWDGINWSQQGGALKHSGLSSSSANGWSVSINSDGNILVVGAPADNSVSIFNKVDNVWTEVPALLTSIDGESYGQSVSISSDGSTIAVAAPGLNPGDKGYVDIWVVVNDAWTLQHSFTETPFGGSIDLSLDGHVLCVGALDGFSQIDITSRTYVYTRTDGNWSSFDTPVIGERRTNTEDYQGFSSSVEYINETDFIVIIGGIGFGSFQGGNWSYISKGYFTSEESYVVPSRSYTIFDLINVLNSGLKSLTNLGFTYEFDKETNVVTISINTDDGVSATVSVNPGNTFDIFNFEDLETSKTSDVVDFSINNNIIKTVNTSLNYPMIYDNEPTLVYRKYEPGYTIAAEDVIDIQLKDERDRIVDLYGADWIMTAHATIHN